MSSKSAGNKIVALLERYAELDWAKTISRNPTIEGIGTSSDQSEHSPYVIFRLKNENNKLIELVRDAIETFRGRLAWVLVAHDRAPLPGTNWTICPKVTIDIATEAENANLSRRDYIRLRMPEVGPKAHDDLLDLFYHLQEKFKASGPGQ
jgi:hypothetical protein